MSLRKGQMVVNWISQNKALFCEVLYDGGKCGFGWSCPKLFHMTDEDFDKLFNPKKVRVSKR